MQIDVYFVEEFGEVLVIVFFDVFFEYGKLLFDGDDLLMIQLFLVDLFSVY